MSVWIQTILGNFAPYVGLDPNNFESIPLELRPPTGFGPEGPEDFWKLPIPSGTNWPFPGEVCLKISRVRTTFLNSVSEHFFPLPEPTSPTYIRGSLVDVEIVARTHITCSCIIRALRQRHRNDRNRLCQLFPAQNLLTIASITINCAC